MPISNLVSYFPWNLPPPPPTQPARRAATAEKPLAELVRAALQLGLVEEVRSAYRNLTELHPWTAAPMVEYGAWLAEAGGGGEEAGAARLCDLSDAAEAIEPGVELPPRRVRPPACDCPVGERGTFECL